MDLLTNEIIIEDVTYLYRNQDYIKACCKEVREVYCTAIYFKDENNLENQGVCISFFGHPNPLSSTEQKLVLKGINAMCNTNFVLREKAKNA